MVVMVAAACMDWPVSFLGSSRVAATSMRSGIMAFDRPLMPIGVRAVWAFYRRFFKFSLLQPCVVSTARLLVVFVLRGIHYGETIEIYSGHGRKPGQR